MPDPRLLKTFLAVAAGLSFRQAAKELHYAPSSVSSQIKALEEELGVPLFDRTGRLVVLTEQGRRLLAHARRLTDLAAATRHIVTGGDDGKLVWSREGEAVLLAQTKGQWIDAVAASAADAAKTATPRKR